VEVVLGYVQNSMLPYYSYYFGRSYCSGHWPKVMLDLRKLTLSRYI